MPLFGKKKEDDSEKKGSPRRPYPVQQPYPTQPTYPTQQPAYAPPPGAQGGDFPPPYSPYPMGPSGGAFGPPPPGNSGPPPPGAYGPPLPGAYAQPQVGSHPQQQTGMYPHQTLGAYPQVTAVGGVPPLHGTFDAGARFGAGSTPNIPPPPPGSMPNVAQFAASQGQTVVVQQEKANWLTGGSGGGVTFW